MKIYTCDACERSFVSSSTLNRHKTQFQCWHCHRKNARKENVIKHSASAHSDPERKFIVVKITNTKYRPEFVRPPRWTPPFEARHRTTGTIHKVRIPTTISTATTSQTETPTMKPKTTFHRDPYGRYGNLLQYYNHRRICPLHSQGN